VLSCLSHDIGFNINVDNVKTVKLSAKIDREAAKADREAPHPQLRALGIDLDT
jgi:hypothetical protein